MSAVSVLEFFAPTDTDLVDGVIASYRDDLAKINRVCQFLHGDGLASVVHFFITGNSDSRQRFSWSVDKLFSHDGAIAALNAHYWHRIMQMTDVLDCMPAKRREEWFEHIQAMTTPEFEEETVRATLSDLLAQRGKFLAERVDGIFRALSREHVTNRPEGFSKRMILTGVTNDWGGYARSQTGHINDLRCIIAKFMHRDEPDWDASNRMVEVARQYHRGEWMEVDGGALRFRCYLNGNAHIDVHPDIAWKLNQILALLYPKAIPSQFRTAPKREARRAYTLMERPLPFAVLRMLSDMRQVDRDPCRLEFGHGDKDKHVLEEAASVLAAIGGVRSQEAHRAICSFGYDPSPVIRQIIVSGCVPDHKSHQFYPTPASLAARAIDLAEIGDGHSCLEPSAGTGSLADLLPKGRTTCVEISALHAAILRQKGFSVMEGDFLEFARDWPERYDRIVMNPPFSQGRWQSHIEAAAGMLSSDGRLVAIVPASAIGKFCLPGLNVAYHGPFDNQFSGASISVTIMVVDNEKRGSP